MCLMVILVVNRLLWYSDPESNFDTARAIMERTYKYFPELTHGKGIEALDIVRQNVGLRPTREGGPRVENEFSSK